MLGEPEMQRHDSGTPYDVLTLEMIVMERQKMRFARFKYLLAKVGEDDAAHVRTRRKTKSRAFLTHMACICKFDSGIVGPERVNDVRC